MVRDGARGLLLIREAANMHLEAALVVHGRVAAVKAVAIQSQAALGILDGAIKLRLGNLTAVGGIALLVIAVADQE